MNRVVDILIAGAGPAGIAAAVSAASSKRSVTLLDDNPDPGGQIWRGGNPRVRWFDKLQRSGAEIVTGARVVYGDASRHKLLVESNDGAHTFTYRKLILATGARELFLPFPGWTAPNVLGAGGLQALVKSGLSIAGKKVILAGTGPFLLAAAAYVHKRGANIPLIAEQAPLQRLARFAAGLILNPGKLLQAAALRFQLRRTRYLSSCWVQELSANVATIRRGNMVWKEPCDYLATGYGFRPNVELADALGCAIESAAVQVDGLQQTTTQDIYAAGECTGIGGVDRALIEGQVAGLAASGRPESASKFGTHHRRAVQFASALNTAFELRPELRLLPKENTIVCRCEDIRWESVMKTRSRREAKLYTRCGMGPCQGRICGPILDFLQFADRDTTRAPVFPARLETLAADEEPIQT